MNGYPEPETERLYLHKDEKNEIYVDLVPKQHHIDGIRFLYKQFKRENPGVIVNNPLGYGDSMTVALFLRAIQRSLQYPILIICKEDDDYEWLEYFLNLLQEHEVIIAAESPFLRKAIFINTMLNLEQFSRRQWGVIVVDDDAFLKDKTLRTKFRADFKIWITPFDMKDHLQMFASIFKWLSPEDKLDIDEFKAKPGDIKDTVAKAIALDAFLQDIVFRTQLLTPIKTPDANFKGTPQKVSKKNKDATGTKIKRSKRLLDNACTSNGIQENSDMGVSGSTGSAVKIPKREETSTAVTGDFSIGNFRNNVESTKQCDVKDRMKCEMDVESFILNKNPIRYDPLQGIMQDCDNISPNNEESRTDLIENEPTIFSTPEKCGTNGVLDVPMDIADNQESCIDSDTNSDSLMTITKSFEESTQDKITSEYDVERNKVTSGFLNDNIINEIKDESSEHRLPETNNDTKSDESVKLEEPDKIVVESPKKNIINELKEEASEPRFPEMNNDTKPEKPVKLEEPGKMLVESPKKDLNSKLMEIDEQISKKFQGSLLDRLF